MTSIDSAAGSRSEGEEVSHFLPSEASMLVELLKDFFFCPREPFAGAGVACGNKNKEQRQEGETSDLDEGRICSVQDVLSVWRQTELE